MFEIKHAKAKSKQMYITNLHYVFLYNYFTFDDNDIELIINVIGTRQQNLKTLFKEIHVCHFYLEMITIVKQCEFFDTYSL